MSHSSSWVTLGLLLLLCGSFCMTQLAEVDFHWHLLAGERILQEGGVPRVDPFTYASAGRPWTDLHWLFEVLLAVVHRSAGWNGLDILKVGLVVSAFALFVMAARWRGGRPSVVAGLAFLALLASQERFTLRPEALSFLLLALVWIVLEERRRRKHLLLLLPVILTIWANCHALYVVGAAVMVLVSLGDLLETRWQRGQGPPQTRVTNGRLLLGVNLAALAGTALTPYGVAGWALPWKLLVERLASENVYARNIAEFQAPFGGYGPTASIGAFAVLVLVIIVGSIAGRRALRPADLLVGAALLGLALLARRNIPLFAMVAVPIGAPMLDATLSRLQARWRLRSLDRPAGLWLARGSSFVVPLLALICLADVWSNRFFERDGTQRYFGRGWSPGFYPEGAADFIRNVAPAGEVIHDMTMGGFLAWSWYPARKTFIDGRLEVHDEALFSTYLRMQGDPALFEKTAEGFGARTVLWSHRHSPEASVLLRYLAEGHGWRPVFVDLAASVFTRAAPAEGPPSIDLRDPGLGEAILEQVRQADAESARLDPAPPFLRLLLHRRPVPVAAVNAALFFAIVGSTPIAETLFREALRQAPRNAIVHYDLGLVLKRAGRTDEARHEFGEALRFDPSLSSAHEALAQLLADGGDVEGALREWSAAEVSSPLKSSSLVARGALLGARGRVDEAIEDYRRASSLLPEDPGVHADLAILYQRRGLKEQAWTEVRRALTLSPHGCIPLTAFGQMSASEGRVEEAERSFRDALASGQAPCPGAERALKELRSQTP